MGKVKLTDICSPKQWKTIPTEQLTEDGYPVYGANGIIGKYPEYNHDAPVIAITCRGATCGNINVTQEKAYVTGNAMCLDNLCADVDLEYLFYALRHYDFSTVISGSAQPQITRQGLGKVSIHLVDFEQQKFIAKTLTKTERIISHRRDQLAKLDELVKCRFVEMFGDPVTNPMNWNVCKLVNACTKLTDGTHSSPENLPEGDFKYVTAKNIKRHGFDFSEITYINEKVHQGIYARCNPEYGDVLYIKDGVTTGIAMVNTLHEEFSLLSSVALLKPCKQKLDSHFLSELLNNDEMYAYVRKGMGGAAITRLTLKKIGDIQIPLPDLALQNSFSSFVHRIDKLRFFVWLV